MKTPATKPPSLNQMERVREIHTLIKRFTKNPRNESLRVTDESLAKRLGASVRTIQRDRAVLDRLLGEKDRERFPGALESPLQFDKSLKSWRYTREVDLSVWVGRLDDEELGALLVAQQSLAVFNGMPLAQKIKATGRRVIGLGARSTTNAHWASSCHVFHYYEDLTGAPC